MQVKSKTCYSYEFPPAPSGWFFTSSRCESLSRVTHMPCSDPKDPAPGRAALQQEQLRREGEGTELIAQGRKNELIACPSFSSGVAYSGITSSIHRAGMLPFPNQGEMVPSSPGHSSGSSTACPGIDLPASR